MKTSNRIASILASREAFTLMNSVRARTYPINPDRFHRRRPHTNGRPTVAFALALVGGLIILASGLLVGLILAFFAYLGGPFLGAVFGLLGILWGILVIFGAIMLYVQPARNRTWGVFIVVTSFLSWYGPAYGGFLFGFVFGVLGGILGIIWYAPRPDV